MESREDNIKTRKIYFCKRRSSGQAQDAMALLQDVNNIKSMTLIHSHCLSISYDIKKLSLQMIENALTEIGFTMDNNWLLKIKRSICAYCEDAERERLGIILEASNNETRLQLAEKQVHDPRPNDWRHYT